MHFGRLEGLFRTLRFRLTFWNTVAILALVLATLVGLREGLRSTLRHELDRLLAEDVDEVRLTVLRFYPEWGKIADELDRKAVSHRARNWFARVLDPGGKLLCASDNAPDLQPPPVQAVAPGPFNVEGYRLVQRTVRNPAAPPFVVRVGASREFIDEDVLRLSEMILVAAAVILLVAPLSGYWLAGRATRPLAAILHTTARLRPDRLVERLPVRGVGDELDQLSATINGMLDRLADHLERQRAFVANAAHELRSPLAALRTTVEVTLDHDRSPEEYRELLADVVEECAGLGGLVNQLLLLAEGDAGLLPSAGRVRLDHLVARSVDMFRGIAEQRGLEVSVGELVPATVPGDDTHLRQVIHNLLDNAIKFTPSGGRVLLGMSLAGDGRQVVLRVTDTGVGIAPEDLPHVFDRFYRADKARHREHGAGGTGLGLSICQAIVHAYGGRVTVDSKPGAGTTLTVLLPLAA